MYGLVIMGNIVKFLILVLKKFRFSSKGFGVAVILLSLLTGRQSVVAQAEKPHDINKKARKAFERAETLFDQRQQSAAYDLLKKSVAYDSLFVDAWLLMGGVLQELDRPSEAQAAFMMAYSIDSTSFPPLSTVLGGLAYRNADYLLAVKMLTIALNDSTLPITKQGYVRDLLQRAELALRLTENPLSTEVKNLSDSVNTPDDEYINFVEADGNRMIITRKMLRDSANSDQPEYAERFLVSTRFPEGWQKPEWLTVPWSEGVNAGGMSMSADGRSMLFTGCYWPNGSGSCDLYFSNRIGDEWQQPERFNNSINTSGWESQPVITADGKVIYFSSKREGGKGGADIWKTVYLPGKGWSPPVNLGDSINTQGDEMAPFIHGDGQTLYFSSNGHPGLGGFDLFLARKDGAGRWKRAENFGFPINSPENEINVFIALDGKLGWLSSDRLGGLGGYDIFSFDITSETAPQPVVVLAGRVVDRSLGKPLEARVEVTNMNNQQEVINLKSDAVTGEFLVVLQPHIRYLFNLSKTGYLFYSEEIDYDTGFSSVCRTYSLDPVLAGLSMNLNHVYFEFNSDTLLPESSVELDKVVRFMNENPEIFVEIIGHTDSIGHPDFNQKLSLRRASSVATYLSAHDIASERLSIKGLGDTTPVGENETEEGRAMNRRTEIVIK